MRAKLRCRVGRLLCPMSMVNSLTVEMVKLDGGDEEEEEKESEVD